MNDDFFRFVSVSGGKDSTAMYLWAMEQGFQFEAVFADTGNEHPVTVNYVKHLHEMTGGPKVHIVTEDYTERLTRKGKEPTGNPFLDMMQYKGRAPSSQAQFCTEQVKLAPIKSWLQEARQGRPAISYIGIRAGESARRAKMPESEPNGYFDCLTVRPLLRWSESDVWAMLEKYGVPPNPLYDLGFGRVGCFPCIHANKSELAILPDWAWDKLQEWESIIGRSWFPPSRLPGGKEIPTIEQVKQWARTDHGGAQFKLFGAEQKDTGACMSLWGACE